MSIEVVEAEALARAIDAEIEACFVETMHESPVSHATEIYHHVRVAVDALMKRLGVILQEQ